METSDLQILKSSVDQVVNIEGMPGDIFFAQVISVFDEEDSPDLFFFKVARNTLGSFTNKFADGRGYSLQLSKIRKVKFVAA